MKRHFKKELVMNKENERHFREDNKCHICNKLYSEKDVSVRNHFRGSPHKICNADYSLSFSIYLKSMIAII